MGFFKLVVLLSALASPCLSKAPPGYVKKPDHDKHPPKYEYSYDVKDGAGGAQGHVESRDGEFAAGTYYAAIPDAGQTVRYFVDDWGYHPLVSYGSSSPHGSSRAQFALGERAVAALRGAPGGLIGELKLGAGPRVVQAVAPAPSRLLVAQGPQLAAAVSPPPRPLALVGAPAAQQPVPLYLPGATYASVQRGATAAAQGLAYQQAAANLAAAGRKLEFTSYLADTNAALPLGARTDGSVQLAQGAASSLVGGDKLVVTQQPPVLSTYTSLRPVVVTVGPPVVAQTASASFVSTSGGSAVTTSLGGTVYSTEKPVSVSSTASFSSLTPSSTPATVIVTPPPKLLSPPLRGSYSQQPIVVPDNFERVPQVVEENNEKSVQYSSGGGQVLYQETVSHVQSNVNSNQENLVVAGGVDNRLQQKTFAETIPFNTYAANYNQQFYEAAGQFNNGQYLQNNAPCDPKIVHVEKEVPVPITVEKPIVIEKTHFVEVEKPVTVESTRYIEVEKPVHFESTKLVAVDRPVPVPHPVPVEVTKLVPVDRPYPYPQPYAVPQPYPYPYPVPQTVRVPVPHLVPYPQAVPVPYKEYNPVYVHSKQTAKTVSSYRKDVSYGSRLKGSVVYVDQLPPRPRRPSGYRSGKNRNLNASRYRPHPKKLCIEYGGFKPPIVPSEQIDEDLESHESD